MDVPDRYSETIDQYRVSAEHAGVAPGGGSGLWGQLRVLGPANLAKAAGIGALGVAILGGMLFTGPDGGGSGSAAGPARGGLVELHGLPPGSCFTLDGTWQPQDGDTEYPAEVRTVSCQEPHRGEVVAQVPLPKVEIRTRAQLFGLSLAACQPAFLDYRPDPWALPQNTSEIAVHPKFRDIETDRSVACVYDGQGLPTRSSLRADRAALSEAQAAYLGAVRPYDAAIGAAQDTGSEATLAELSDSARDVAAAEQRTVDALARLDVPADARDSLASLIDGHRAALADWQAAAGAADRAQAVREIEAAQVVDKATQDAARAVRRSLGLATSVRAVASI
ncbi:hypothetical protein ACGFX4_00135 [Kitasatospora sp. NPDC048365]|uniref:hypothetical protein n=1 Tax=Kitasatospora sp. NPDC048365 TaxID=3364050 RepID=UPI0037121605